METHWKGVWILALQIEYFACTLLQEVGLITVIDRKSWKWKVEIMNNKKEKDQLKEGEQKLLLPFQKFSVTC